MTPWDFSNPDTTHICHQTGEVLKTAEWIQEYQKPLMIDETGYEGSLPFGWGNLSAFELVKRFWAVCVQGGYCTHGETYLNEEEILWWSKGGRLTGQSPERIRFLKNIIDALPGSVEAAGHIWTEAEFYHMREQVTEQQRKVPFTRMMLGLTWEQARGILGANRELVGQFIRTIGLIPSNFMISSLLGDALDDVEEVSGERCDGFSSSVFNCIITMAFGVAFCIFNYGITYFGYQAPTAAVIPVQNTGMQNLITFCVTGVQAAAYPVILVLLAFFKNNPYSAVGKRCSK